MASSDLSTPGSETLAQIIPHRISHREAPSQGISEMEGRVFCEV